MALYGGLRLEEVLPLLWSDVDYDGCTIDINKSLTYVPGAQIVRASTKTDGSTRRITLPAHVFEMLKKLQAESTTDRLFDMHYCTPGNWLKKTIAKYNRLYDVPLPLISFHGLRHTNATLLISQGLDVRTVSGRLGHSDASTTLNIYSHYIKSRDEAASGALEKLLAVGK